MLFSRGLTPRMLLKGQSVKVLPPRALPLTFLSLCSHAAKSDKLDRLDLYPQ